MLLPTGSDPALKAPIASPTFTGTVTLPSGQTLVAPVLGTPASGSLPNCTGLPESGVTNLVTDLAAKAPSASPTFTGTTTFSGGAATLDVSSGNGTISASGGGNITISAPTIITGAVKDSGSSFGSNGQVLTTNGSGVLTYGNNKGSYVLPIGALSQVSLAASTTDYGGWNYVQGLTGNQGRYKTYIPKTGTIKTILFYMFGAGGDGAHNVTFDIWLNNTTSVGSSTLVANVFPGQVAATGLSQAVTGNGISGDSIELRVVTPSGMTTITVMQVIAHVYIETAL